jgi:hypothetical protein
MRRLLIALVLTFVASTALPQAAFYWNILSLDKFSYANGNLSGQSNWVVVNGGLSDVTLSVVSNTLQCSHVGVTDCGNQFNIAYPNDQCSQVQVNTLNAVSSASFQVLVRSSSSASTFYGVAVTGPLGATASMLLFKNIAGSVTTLVTATTETVNSGDLVGVCAQGTSLYVTLRGTKVAAFNYTDSSIASGQPGLIINSNGQAPTDVVLANWSGMYLGTSVPPSGVVAIKWTPGHYFNYPVALSQAPINPTNQSTNWSSFGPDMRGSINSATGKPGFKGIENDYSWFYLEPTGGPTDGTAGGGTLPAGVSSTVYNTILIDTDLATLASASAADGVTYKLIILVMSEYWQAPGTLPTVPQGAPYGASNNSSSIAPDYIITGVGGFGTDLVRTQNTATVALWRPATMTAYINLFNYLGKKYDGNPNVEGIVPIPETGLTWNSSGPGSEPADYSASAYQTQYEAMATALSVSWPTTNKFFNDNWGIQGEALSTMAARFPVIAGNTGWGFGGPDVIYLTPYGATTPHCTATSTTQCETSGEAIVQGEGSSYGTNVFKGKVPLGFQVQANAYSWTNQTSAGTESYGFSNLGVTHFIWIDTQTNGNSTQTLAGVRTAINSAGWRINGACPTNYAACK